MINYSFGDKLLRSWLFELNPLLVLFHTPLNLPLGMHEWASPYLSHVCCCGDWDRGACLEPLQLASGLSQSANTTEKLLFWVLSFIPSLDLEEGSLFLPHVVIRKVQLP